MANIQCDFDYSTLSTSISHNENMDYVSEESSSDTTRDLKIPSDRFNLVLVTFGLLGIGTLLPWNFFITANDYWMNKFHEVKNDSGNVMNIHSKNNLQTLFASYLSLSNNVPYVVFLVISTAFNNKMSKFHRIIGSLMMMVILFIIFTVLVNTETDTWQKGFFSLTMFLVVIMSVFSALLQSGATGVASIFPSQYMHIFVLGQAAAGVFATFAQITSLLGHSNPFRSAFAYFLCADVTLIFTLLSYLAIQKSSFYQFYVNNLNGDSSLKCVSGSDSHLNTQCRISSISVLKLVWPYAISIMIDFWVTIAVFPGVAVLVVSKDNSPRNLWAGRLFLPLSCFLLFNISDLCGRAAAGWLSVSFTWKFSLLALCIARIIFIPLFMLCNAYPRANLPVIFASDAFYIAFITLLGFSNGFLVTVAMINGTKSVDYTFQEIAGVILSMFLGIGLMLGSVSSYIIIIFL